LREAVFPSAWKIARLMLLRKKDKPENDPFAYRPICLLDESGNSSNALLRSACVSI